MVTALAKPDEASLLQEAWSSPEIISDAQLGELDEAGLPLVAARIPRSRTHRRDVIPVRHAEATIALVTRDTGRLVDREGSLLETAYIDAAEDLFRMVADGTFPPAVQSGEIHTGPEGRRRAAPP